MRTSMRGSSGTSSSSLFYHEDSPELVLRPTAPACAWRRLSPPTTTDPSNDNASTTTTNIQELSLLGWSFPAVLEKLLPALSAFNNDNEQGEPEQDVTTTTRRRIQVLNIVSTELWVSSQWRSPFALGVDHITALLLQQQACFGSALHTLCISRACSNKSLRDWQLFGRALAAVPNLCRLELCDAADACSTAPPNAAAANAAAANHHHHHNHNVSSLLEILAQLALSRLQVLKIHLNALQPGCLSIRAWHSFVTQYQHQLQVLSLHMIRVVVVANTNARSQQSPLSPPATAANVRWDQLHTLHLTMMDFVPATRAWEQFFLQGQQQQQGQPGKHSSMIEAAAAEIRLGLLANAPHLGTLSLVSPTMTARQYRAVWHYVFGQQVGGGGGLQNVYLDATSMYTLLGIKQPKKKQTTPRNDALTTTMSNHNRSLMGVEPTVREAMRPSLAVLLECWRKDPPIYFRQCRLPFFALLFDNNNDDDNDSHHDDDASSSWDTVGQVWNLYRRILPKLRDLHSAEALIQVLTRMPLPSSSETLSTTAVFHRWSTTAVFHLLVHCGTHFCAGAKRQRANI